MGRRRRKLAAAGCSEEESPLALVLHEFHKSDADDEDMRQWQKNHDSGSYYYCQHDDVLLP